MYIGENAVIFTSGGHANERQINIINIKNKKSEKISNVFLPVMVSCLKKKALIYCVEMKGKQKIIINDKQDTVDIKNETVLSWPTGISVDTDGNVYVVRY